MVDVVLAGTVDLVVVSVPPPEVVPGVVGLTGLTIVVTVEPGVVGVVPPGVLPGVVTTGFSEVSTGCACRNERILALEGGVPVGGAGRRLSPGTVSETTGSRAPSHDSPLRVVRAAGIVVSPAETPYKAHAESHDKNEPDHNRAIW